MGAPELESTPTRVGEMLPTKDVDSARIHLSSESRPLARDSPAPRAGGGSGINRP